MFINQIYGLDQFDRLRYNEKFFVASLNYELSGLGSPALYNIFVNQDSSNFNIISKSLTVWSNNSPKIISGVLLNGIIDDIYFHIEPNFVNAKFGKTDLGIDYSRKNISARIENAFIHYYKNNLTLRFGRSAHWWGKSISNSIIQSGMFPSYDHFFIQYKFNNFNIEMLHGQLGSGRTDSGERIKRYIAGHRLSWRLNDKILLSIGDQIIYSGENRSIELTYLNPFVPYFFTGLEGEEEDHLLDNDNSIIFSDFKILINKNHSIYGELIIDDFQIDDTGVEDATGYKIGFDGRKNKNLFYILEWTKIAPWTYLHPGQNTSWINNSHPIGYSLGPGSKCLKAKIIKSINQNIDLLLDMSYVKKGENNIGTIMDNQSIKGYLNESKEYLIGQVGIIFKHKYTSAELGWLSKNFEDHLIDGKTSFDRNSMFFIKLILQLKQSFKII